ncbi:aspartate/glutamate racemase family protein [Bombilactobacillus thymidiniphilus]|uniref:Amino acid racemase n=1 Tax=Bombilactobacillus thymidiniphilus TaxID=2923363 RepID=A0ABY4PF83_9LACO|nr:amino acid racemase [Bombilactobacillus thymidiniphilus]UQS84217.1 amino acid racemase [Bombilactobacillus thymidiniphilus]
MKNFFTVIGGMGTQATESYLRLLNARTPAKCDQDFLNYILVNHATVPDRTAYILDHSQPSFYPDLLEDIQQQSLLKPDFMVLICNTAHFFYEQLQAATAVPLLHMPRMAVRQLKMQYPHAKKVGLIATKGTLADQIYQTELTKQGYEVTVGDTTLQKDVMALIYEHIKEKGQVDVKLYHSILERMQNDFGAQAVILGCTELSVAQEKAAQHPYAVIDAQSVIVDASIALAQQIRSGNKINIQDGVIN